MYGEPTIEKLVARVERLEQETTDHKVTKEKVARTSSILKATLEATADGIVIVNLYGRIISFNRRFQVLCGISESVMASKDDNLILSHIMDQVKDPEIFLEKVGEIYDSPEVEVRDEVEFKDGRIFKRVSLPQILNNKIVGRVWSFQDITEAKHVEVQLKETLVTLRKALGGTIQAIALTVEKRDPYTAGHQQRVSDLARAIADEMGLPKATIDGIRLAGSIHDLGKTSVPTDIMSKPGKLTDHEFGIIKTHPTVGYEILRNIQFPWPIAKAVLQHHERIDGSGYPDGLKGDEIIIEAKVIAVADVVEAISSHRPYRPSLGLQIAIDEIVKGRGNIYDAKAVDTCIDLLTKKRYKFRFSAWNLS
jgi:PAS domain S-box-containing protein/putative nucleotidyltransferase with HDIG domain